jgi:hypothetical protein
VHGFDVDFGHLSVFGRCEDCVAADLQDDADLRDDADG